MLHKLTLKNFKKHENLEVDFESGLNGIFGENYSGKTTILKAVMFCIGGASTYPRSVWQRNGSTGKFEASLVFSAAGKKYRVTRSKASDKVFILEGGGETLAASGTTPVNLYIKKVLGMSPNTFRGIRFCEQKKADTLLTIGAPKLYALVDEVSGAGLVDKVMTKLKERVSVDSAALSMAAPVDDTMDWEREISEASEQEVLHRTNLESALASLTGEKSTLHAAIQSVQESRRVKQEVADASKAATLAQKRVESAAGELAELQTALDECKAAGGGGDLSNLRTE